MNKPEKFSVTNGQLKIEALKGTDFFNDPESGESTSTAPFLFKELEGDFVAVLKLRPDFSSQWNAGAIFMMIDESNWIKFAFSARVVEIDILRTGSIDAKDRVL